MLPGVALVLPGVIQVRNDARDCRDQGQPPQGAPLGHAHWFELKVKAQKAKEDTWTTPPTQPHEKNLDRGTTPRRKLPPQVAVL